MRISTVAVYYLFFIQNFNNTRRKLHTLDNEITTKSIDSWWQEDKEWQHEI